MPSAPNQLPPFAGPKAGGFSLAIKPPFSFTGVNTLCFPLRASLESLQRFCDNYLNTIPAEIGRFRAPMPYVYLMMLDYGRMAIDVANVGWLAQREIAFCVPLEWYKVVDGRWVFHDWATICPFIYVDDDMSMAVGRGVYGWPKVAARMTPRLSDWMSDPMSPITEATLSTSVFPELYAGSRMEDRIFLEVERLRAPSLGSLPFDTGTAFMPWNIWSSMAETMNGFARDATTLMTGLGFVPMHRGSTGDNYMAMLQKMVEQGFPLQPNLSANTLNLKQFRRSEVPSEFAYQALTNGPMRYTQLNRMGLLGPERNMLGDVSGGFTIKLHRWPTLPIVETLGLEVSGGWKGQDVDVALLKPVMPIWYDVNMEYLPGYNVAWRTRDDIWHDREGKAYPIRREDTHPPVFNTTLGAGNKAVAGPFHFSDTTLRVMPLLARRPALERFIEEYLNEPLADGEVSPEYRRRRFSVWASAEDSPGWTPGSEEAEALAYVYLTATSFGDVTSDTDNIGDWADVEVSFLVPVRYEEQDPTTKEWIVTGVGVVPTFTYLDGTTAVTARSEVLGIPAYVAQFDSPESAWLNPEGAAERARQTLLAVQTEVLPAVGEGQRASRKRIMHVVDAAPAEMFQPFEWRNAADRWSALLKAELRRKRHTASNRTDAMDAACALALEPLSNRVPLSFYTLKQFRDIADADRACYQSLVRVHRTLKDVFDVREIEEPLMLHIHEFPTQPIMKLLGIVGREVEGDGDGVCHAVQPIRPFSIRATLDESLGEMLCYRAGNGSWSLPEDESWPVHYFDDAARPAANTARAAAHDTGDPRRLSETAAGALSGSAATANLTISAARDAVRTIDPQMVIEALLSREWGNWSDEGRWLLRRDELKKGIAEKCLGMDARHQVEMELSYLQEAITGGSSKPRLVETTREFLDNILSPLGKKCAAVESAWIDLFDMAEEQKAFAANQTKPKPEYARTPRVVIDLMQALRDMSADQNFVGNPVSPEGSIEYTAARNAQRLVVLLDELAPLEWSAAAVGETPTADSVAQLAAIVFASGDKLREAVALTRWRQDVQLEALLNMLARDAQKPDFVVPRSAGGPEADRVFPLDQSWDRHWYDGPQMGEDTQLMNSMRKATPAAGTAALELAPE